MLNAPKKGLFAKNIFNLKCLKCRQISYTNLVTVGFFFLSSKIKLLDLLKQSVTSKEAEFLDVFNRIPLLIQTEIQTRLMLKEYSKNKPATVNDTIERP